MGIGESARKRASNLLRRAAPEVSTEVQAVRDTPAHLAELEESLAGANERLDQMQGRIDQLERDLDESRRLNLRAAELLDIVSENLVQGPSDQPVAEARKR